MNTKVIRDKIEDLIAMLNLLSLEATEIDEKRSILEKDGYAASDREKRLNDRELTLVQREKELSSEKQYTAEQHANNQRILATISKEKEALRDLEHQRLQLVADKKEIEGLVDEKEQFEKERNEFEKEKAILSQEKAAVQEHQKRLSLLDKRLGTERERLQNLYNDV